MTEDDNSEDDSDSRDAQYRCQHCFTTSKKSVLFYLFRRLNLESQVREIGKPPEKTGNYSVGTAGLI